MNKIYELKNQRANLLNDAEKALETKDMELYNSKMAEIKTMNTQIEALENLNAENGKFGQEPNGKDFKGLEMGLTDRNDKEYMNAFFYAITNGITPKTGVNNDKLAPLYNALTETGGSPAGSDGGFLVPIEFNNMINEQRRQLISLANYFNVENVNTLSGWRAVDVAPTAGFEAIDEMGTINDKGDKPKFTKVTYTLSKYGLRVPVSSELINDNTAGLMAYLARWFAKKGVITENAKLKTLLATLTPANLTVGKEVDSLKKEITKKLDPSIAQNAVVITNQSGFAYLDGLTGTDGRGLLQPDPTTGTPMLFKNKPVVVLSDAELPNRVVTTTGATKGEYYPVYVGDFKAFGTLFKRNALEVATTDIGGNAWASGSTEVRGIIRLDAQKLDGEAAILREIFVAAA